VIRKPEFTDEGIRLAGTLAGVGIIGASLLVAALAPTAPADRSWFWQLLSFWTGPLILGLTVLALTGRMVGDRRGWVLAAAAVTSVLVLAMAWRATDTLTPIAAFDSGTWAFLRTINAFAAPILLLLVLGIGGRTAGRVGVLGSIALAVMAVGIGFHVTAVDPAASDGWRLVGATYGSLASAIAVFIISSLLVGCMPPFGWQRVGMGLGLVVLMTGTAYSVWARDLFAVSLGRLSTVLGLNWLFVSQMTTTVAAAMRVLLAADALRRLDVLVVVVAGLAVASVAFAVKFSTLVAANGDWLIAMNVVSTGASCSVLVFWWLLNERERGVSGPEVAEAPSEDDSPVAEVVTVSDLAWRRPEAR
jgi:hypothetical protein